MSEELREGLAAALRHYTDPHDAADVAIAYIRQHDGHAEFVRAVKDEATAAEGYLSLDGRTRNWAAFMAAQRILSLCDAELAKEQP